MRRLLLISVLLMLLSSCQQEPLHVGGKPGREEELQQRKVELAFRLNAGTTKASIDNSDPETKVTNLLVIARPVDAVDSWSKSVVTTFDNPSITAGQFRGDVNACIGNNVFYVLVNYTQEMLDFIGSGKGLRESRESAFCPDLSSESTFGGKQQKLLSQFMNPSRGYTMMAKCTHAGDTLVNVAPDATALALDGDLHRMLAKVHMEFDVYEQATDQVVVLGYLDNHASEIPNEIRVHGLESGKKGSQSGWVPLSSIRYCLNAVNTKVFLQADDDCTEPTVFPLDPNYHLDDTIEASGADWKYKDGYGDDFVFCDPNGASELFDAYPSAPYPAWMATASSGSSLYCLENTVSSRHFLDGFDENTSYRRFAPRRATTHLLVEARFIPRYIIVGRNGDSYDYHVGFERMEDAITFLGGDGTFWTHDLKHFFNESGKNAEIAYTTAKHAVDPKIAALTESDFVKYKEGKCYYTAYISGGQGTDPDSGRSFLTFKEGDSSIRRDASYTLKAKVLHVPSINMSMMEINTTGSLEWNDFDKNGVVNIKP